MSGEWRKVGVSMIAEANAVIADQARRLASGDSHFREVVAERDRARALAVMLENRLHRLLDSGPARRECPGCWSAWRDSD